MPPDLRPHARVLLVITPAVTETVLRDMERAQAATSRRRLRDRRQCGYDQIAYAIKAADALRPGADWRTAAARNP